MKFTFLILSLTLLVSHSVFFLRAFILRNRGFKPLKIDQISKNLAHLLLPITVIFGSIITRPKYLIILWLPIILIIMSQVFRNKLRRNPYLLPMLNLLIIFAIVIISYFTLV